MSMINEQVKELRKIAKNWNPNVPINPVSVVLNKAADTIESLSAKLQAANMEVESLREITRCDGEWIYCADENRLPSESGEYRTVSNCQEVFIRLNFDVSDKAWHDDGGQYRDVIAWWKEYPYEI